MRTQVSTAASVPQRWLTQPAFGQRWPDVGWRRRNSSIGFTRVLPWTRQPDRRAALTECQRLAKGATFVADRPSGDHPDSTSGKIGPDRQSIASGLVSTDGEQTLASADQTLSDGDQTSAESDQVTADSDQAAADRDQEASDRNLAHGGDPLVYEFTRGLRERAARQRAQVVALRARTAAGRDAVADARDLIAAERDRASLSEVQPTEPDLILV